jgi:CRP/FNR family transcriptional regulator
MDIHRKDVHNSDTPVLCQACESRHRGVCGALNGDQLLRLSKHSTRRTVEPGTELVGESLQAKTYSNIISGVVKLSKMMADGRQQIVGLQFAPDFLGRPFRAENGVSAEAATEVQVCSFSKQLIERMISEMPELEHKLLEQTLNELDEARNWMLTLGRKTAAEKVASFVLLIATHAFPDNEKESIDVRSANEPGRYRRFPWPDHGNREPAAHQIAQGRRYPYRQQQACHSARYLQAFRARRLLILAPACSFQTPLTFFCLT